MGAVETLVEGIKGRFGGMTRETLRADAMAGVVVGVEGVPDSLASGVLAGVNPVAATYGYIYGMAFGAVFTGTAMMGMETTGASAIVIADAGLKNFKDPNAALFTLAVLTGVVMLVAGLMRGGRLLQFVSKSVMTGFIAAVGINIVLGQLSDFTGYDGNAKISGRIRKTLDLILHFYDIKFATLAVGVVTLVLVATLKRTRLGAMGLVVGVVGGSILAAVFQAMGTHVKIVNDVAKVPGGLPWFTLPNISYVPGLLLPAISLAFVGLMQGAAITAKYPVSKKKPNNPSADFIGEGAGCIAAGLFQGTPVSGSVGASQLAADGGAKTRLVFPLAAFVMTVIILFLGGVISYVAMPSLAALLIYIGASMVDFSALRASIKTGHTQRVAMWLTLVLTIVIPLQYSVLIGVGVTILLHTTRQSEMLMLRQLKFDGTVFSECEPPDTIGKDEVVVLQVYGSLYFATAMTFEKALPRVTDETDNSVVQLRLRGIDEVGATVGDTFQRYIAQLRAARSKLVIVTNNQNFHRALEVDGVLDKLGRDNIVDSDAELGKASRETYEASQKWIDDNRTSHSGAAASTSNSGASKADPNKEPKHDTSSDSHDDGR